MEKAVKFLRNNLHKNDIVVIALSGGPDSMFLFHTINSLKKEYDLKVIAAHVNHNVRVASAEEEIIVKDYVEKNNCIFETTKFEQYGEDNFHNEARQRRYKFFEDIINKYHANYLLTAHHGDDLIETVLMRIVRGSTLSGYAGFDAVIKRNNYTIMRPLINYTKEEILNYVVANKIPYVIDESNDKEKYTRNRYRKHLLTFLKNEDKNVHTKFLHFSENIKANENYINKILEKIIKKVYINNTILIDELKKEDNFIQNRVVENVLNSIYQDNLSLINNSHVNMINMLINSDKASLSISLPNNIVFKKSYNKIYIEKKEIINSEYKILIKDIAELPNNMIIKKIEDVESKSNTIIRMCSKDIKLPLYVRTRHNGDKMYVKKLNGQKKINDIFIDNKIEINERDLWPILVDSNDEILWLPGLKKSKFDKEKPEYYDIILKYEKKERDYESKK